MRGKVTRSASGSVGNGITPACAGKSQLACHPGGKGWDHPRVCGEKDVTEMFAAQEQGSPPRVRGKEILPRMWNTPLGITPACAGKRFGLCIFYGTAQDHPRVCGEKKGYTKNRKSTPGSPPRVRGKGNARPYIPPCRGITPACAGKSWYWNCYWYWNWDHPRVCGEKVTRKLNERVAAGSPPRVRGKENSSGSPPGLLGITPACAGKSCISLSRWFFCGDHPRVCGEKESLCNS